MPTYFIRVRGHLPDRYAAWFDDLGITRAATGETVLAGELPDQGALFGVLLKIRDLGLPLLAVTCESGQAVPDITTVQIATETLSPPDRDIAACDDLAFARLPLQPAQSPLQSTWHVICAAGAPWALLALEVKSWIGCVRLLIRLPAALPALSAYA